MLSTNGTLLYIVATDSRAPGEDYKVIGGTVVLVKGRDRVRSYEIPTEVACQMKSILASRGPAPKIAIVETTNGHEQVIQIV